MPISPEHASVVHARACAVVAAGAALLAGCAPHPRPSHAPPFATVPYSAFSRAAAVAVAQGEWRLFGAPIDDDQPGTRATLPTQDKPERQQGLWQRIGEYWYIGQPPGDRESGWTGKHDETGAEFPAARDGDYAWSAAFISYVMRMAGAGDRFPYASNHSTYINVAREISLGQASGFDVTAERVTDYAPRSGDLICAGRGAAAGIGFDALPAGTFTSHCDIVVAQAAPDQAAGQAGTNISVIGGNVDDAVTLKHVPVAIDGRLVGANGVVLDTRYPWFVVLRVLYAR